VMRLRLMVPPTVTFGLRLWLELVVGVEPRAVVPIVLHEAEVDRHLAQSAGHSLRPPLCGGSLASDGDTPWLRHRGPGSTWSLRLSALAEMTIYSAVVRLVWRRYPSRGRTPSTALPTRTCVAPAVTASSRSELIPAETMFAAGCLTRRWV